MTQRWVPHQQTAWYVPGDRPKLKPGDTVPLVPLDSDGDSEFLLVIDSVNADGSSVGHLRDAADPCGGSSKGGEGCTCEPPFGRG